MKTIIRVPATTANLGPGFDSLGLALSLWNELEVEARPFAEGISLEIEGFGADSLPSGDENLVVRSARYVFAHAGMPAPGMRLTCRNGFPGGSGLGSSSSAILMGLLAANGLLPASLAVPQLLDIAQAIEGHPDNVTPALLGGLTMSVVIDGAVVTRRLDPAPGWWASVAVPSFAASTEEMRRALPEQVSLGDAVANIGRAPLVVQAFLEGDVDLLRIAIADRIHQPYRLPLIPGASAAISRAQELRAAAALSGAGPGVVAFTREMRQASDALRAMQAAFASSGLATWAWLGGIDEAGASVRALV